MSSSEAQIAFQQGGRPIAHVEAQDKFAQQFDLESPEKAMSSYQHGANADDKSQTPPSTHHAAIRVSGGIEQTTVSGVSLREVNIIDALIERQGVHQPCIEMIIHLVHNLAGGTAL
ncbi:hypothetical protein LTR97_009273 [Elasticomyces elasticus]|uniref:Uncharacterized protein n=1 Tax=Elasticomyces elasticus TaxID=574655 RepID=A0AAN7ZM32_9PEZI|nr:hypothetical protein LTR97_009273 [Elasticomyces elasticus]